jgi:hypothetical protein
VSLNYAALDRRFPTLNKAEILTKNGNDQAYEFFAGADESGGKGPPGMVVLP